MAEDNTSFCDSSKAAAIQCVAMDMTGQCSSCIDIETLAEAFPGDIKKLFASTQAFAIPGTDQFCSVANDRICAEVDVRYSCCCSEPIAAWQNCLVENVYSQELSLPEPCSSSCGGNSGGGGGGSSTAMIGAITAVAVIFVLGVTWWFCRRRRMRAAAAVDGVNKADEKQRGLATLSEDSHKEMGTLDDMEEGHSLGSSGNQTPPNPIPTDIVHSQLINDNSVRSEQEEERPKPRKEASSRARDKKKAIEEWNKMKKAGSNRSLESFVSKDDRSENDEESLPEKKRSSKISKEGDNDLRDRDSNSQDKAKLPKKISSRDLGRIIKENAENANMVRELEQEMLEMEDRLYSADREAEKLRNERDEVQRRLEEIEAQNKALRREARSSSGSEHHRARSKSRGESRERRSRDRSGERKSSSKHGKSKERRPSGSRSSSARSLTK
jgi:hypothetical protein